MSKIIVKNIDQYDLRLLVKFANGNPDNCTLNSDTNELYVPGVDYKTLKNTLNQYHSLYEKKYIDIIKEDARKKIDRKAEETRLKFVTTGSAQSMAYQEKSEEAMDYAANGYPRDLSDYPFIQAGVNATNTSPREVADEILAQKSVWIVAGSKIEEIRLKGKSAISKSNRLDEVIKVRDSTKKKLDTL